MIDRYTNKALEGLFSDESRFQAYWEIELAVLEAYVSLGIVPAKDYELIKSKAKVDVKRIKEIEEITRHDVVAFTRQVGEGLGEEKRWIHYGLTSTDVVDTAMSLLYKKANAVIIEHIDSLLKAVKAKAIEYKNTPCIGRTHGMHGEIISFGFKWANYYAELLRGKERFEKEADLLCSCKLSGAMGNFANIDPKVQEMVAVKLGLRNASDTTQVLPRDLHEGYASALAILASTEEKIAVEIRNLSRSEIGEVAEGFGKGQKGSSAMPQKRNPIASENITGCARMIRGYLTSIMEDNALYHERDISHSSVERVALIDMITLFDYATARMAGVIDKLEVYPERMLANINLSRGAIFAQRVLNALVEKGAVREEAYDTIQPYAIQASLGGTPFKDAIKDLPLIKNSFSEKEFNELFEADYYLRRSDAIYSRIPDLE